MNESRLAFMRKWRDLGPRTLSAIVMVAIGAAAIFAGHMAFSVVVVCAGVIGLWELVNMASQKQQNSGLTALDKLWLGLYGLVVLLGIIGLLYVSYDAGLKGVLYIVVLVVITDTCGYFIGKLVGGRKFWPSISPNKTWSGVLGGWFGSAVFSLIWLQTVPQIPAKPHGAGGVSTAWLEADNASTGIYMIIGFAIGAVLLSFASQMGDIAQSSVKRRMGIKDSSNLIPGHGGILDRFDALLAVGALSLIFNVLF